jgi:UDP-N-acetylglucosamine:LPS N-acetylglucosamine transferase
MQKILFCGGGTLGPVTPLLAVLRKMRQMRPDLGFAWVGTEYGPEAALVEAEGVAFHALPRAAWPRYPSKRWLTFPFDYLRASKMARQILDDEQASLVVSAGGFMQVPVIRAAAKQGIPCAVHQLDYVPLLSNKAVAGKCRLVTSSFAYSKSPFGDVKVIRIATPCRFYGVDIPSRKDAAASLNLDPLRPTLFVFGGGTGALALNEAIASVLDELLKMTQIVHLTGKGKAIGHALKHRDYHVHEFFDETQMLNAYAAADLVVSRGGFGTLSEMAALKIAAIVVPIPQSPWIENVEALGDAVRMVRQTENLGNNLLKNVKDLLADDDERQSLGRRLNGVLPVDDGAALAGIWLDLAARVDGPSDISHDRTSSF